MITLANIRKAIYCLNKRIDLLEQNGISGGSSGEGASSSEVAEIRGKVEALESIISEGDNPTAAIDKFNEIVAFLESIQNTDTLSGILADIAALIPTNVSELLNDAGYLTQHLDISGKSDKLSMNGENAAVEDNIMSISSNGNPKDSGISVNNIALKTGYYKNLHAGLADNLFGSTQTSDVFTFRPTAGIQDVESGDAPVGGGTIKKVEGNAVAWNQLIGAVNVYLNHENYSTYRVPFDIDNTNGTTKLYGFIQYGGDYFLGLPATIINHRYYTRNTVEFTSNDTFNLFYATSQQSSGLSENVGASVSLCTVSCPSDRLRVRGLDPGKHITGYITIIRIDLTLLGIDNLTTVEEVEQWLANNVGLKSYYPYNEGELIPVKDFKVKSVGFNALSNGTAKVLKGEEYEIVGTYTAITLDGETITPSSGKFTPTKSGTLTVTGYDDTTCVHLAYDGDRDGDYEEYWERNVTLDPTKFFGKLNGAGNLVQCFAEGMRAVYSTKDVVDLTHATATVKVEKRAYASGDESDATVITDGTNTFAVLATPLTYTDLIYRDNGVDTPVSELVYRVDNYGTEEVLLGNEEGIVSCSPKMTISYGINAADTIADLQNNYVSTNPLNLTSSLKLLIKLNLELSYNDLKDKPTIPQIWRGTLVLYDALVANNQIDNNTIYVIIESLS